jgi:hypothetical protein
MTHAIDPDASRAAFEGLRARLDGLAADEFIAVNVDVGQAAIAAAAVGRAVKEPEVRAWFGKLPAELFDMADVDALEDAALAAWYARVQQARAQVSATEVRVPVALIDDATGVKRRMLKVASYYLEDDPDGAAEVADIRQGTGYADLARDLQRLAALYEQHAATFASDRRYYRAADRAEAGRLANEIVRALGEASADDHATWTDYVARAWTLLLAIYGEVSAAGRWLYRREDAERRFPSLYRVARSRRRAPQPDDAADGAADGAAEPGESAAPDAPETD